MGLFSKKPADSKARIEELKKKIQAEQAAFAATVEQASAPLPVPPAQPIAPAPPSAAPAPQPAPQPVHQPAPQAPPAAPAQQWQQPVYHQPPRQEQQWQQPAPVYQPPRPAPVFRQQYEDYEPPVPQPVRRQSRPLDVDDLFDEEPTPMEEIKTGIIVDLGEGMSLNLPIRSRMRLEEFLHIADRVRELQRVQHQGPY